MKEMLHFAHGNGFPSPCYQQLFHALEDEFDCCYVDKVGHSPDFPVSENWSYLVQEVIASIQTQTMQPVIAVGHSLGGVLSLLAAIQEPQLFKMLILLDSPLINRLKSNLVRLSKAAGMIDRITPAFHTKKRQQSWPTRQEALSHFQTKPLFRHFTKECLDDYIDYGLQKDKGSYSLRFDREVECQIYRTIPHTLAQYEGKLAVPTFLIYAKQSTVVDKFDRRYMKKKYGIKSIKTNGTHMFPMEHPNETAQLIKMCWKQNEAYQV